jgi:peptide/nickel transport system substrate-binding protein
MGALAAALLALGAAACGDDSPGGGGSTQGGPAKGQKTGGALKVLAAESLQNLDPGGTYFQVDYQVVFATQRPLYSYAPDDPQTPKPDLADGEPVVSADAKTVTVRIKRGVRFSPPVSREVTSADVKYAFERALNPSVANGYFGTYFGDIVGADSGKGGPLAGITTPDDHTIVFKLTKPTGATVAKALVMPVSAPVPKEYAAKLDAKSPSQYSAHPERQAFTGPYMVRRYAANRSLTLVRNPNWDAKTDARPAYVDRIEFKMGADPNVAGRQILNGRNLVSGDAPPAPIVKRAVTKHKGQVFFTPYGNRYITLNTTKKPFADINVRRAIGAVLDRRAMQLTRGGALTGDIATHLLPPTIAGYAEAGGAAGPAGANWLTNPDGDRALAASYLKKAGFASGRYSGPAIVAIADNSDPALKTAQVVLDNLQQLGFKVKFRPVDESTFYSRFCTVTSALKKLDICINYGWLPDFNDPQAMLDPTFNGANLVPVNNPNPALLDDKAVNAKLDEAKAATDPGERARLFGEADRLITESAAVIPWYWDKEPNIESSNVQGVIAQWNALFDLAYTSIK